MKKEKLYPKTRRVSQKNNNMITEKINGANLGFFRKNDKLIIAQRRFWYTLEEINNIIDGDMVGGLKSWLEINGTDLLERLHEGSGIFGEWLSNSDGQKFYIFAKANLNDEMKVYNIYYDHDLFIYPFIDQKIPEYFTIVPIVKKCPEDISIPALDKLFIKYEEKVGREVEGFIVIKDKVNVTKYVRRKRGKLEPIMKAINNEKRNCL